MKGNAHIRNVLQVSCLQRSRSGSNYTTTLDASISNCELQFACLFLPQPHRSFKYQLVGRSKGGRKVYPTVAKPKPTLKSARIPPQLPSCGLLQETCKRKCWSATHEFSEQFESGSSPRAVNGYVHESFSVGLGCTGSPRSKQLVLEICTLSAWSFTWWWGNTGPLSKILPLVWIWSHVFGPAHWLKLVSNFASIQSWWCTVTISILSYQWHSGMMHIFQGSVSRDIYFTGMETRVLV